MDDLVRIQKEEIEKLRERIAQLEELLMPTAVQIPLEWQLPRCEARIFAMLTQRETVTKEALYLALYGDRFDAHEYPVELVESHMSKMRKRLKPFGVHIIGRRFLGYTLIDRLKYSAREVIHG